jgi:hypothetical protein
MLPARQDDNAPDYIKEFRKEASSTVALANGSVNRGKKSHTAVGPSAATVAAGTVGRFNPEAGVSLFVSSIMIALLKYLCFLARADADPLGVDLNVNFDQVGGLDGRESMTQADACELS